MQSITVPDLNIPKAKVFRAPASQKIMEYQSEIIRLKKDMRLLQKRIDELEDLKRIARNKKKIEKSASLKAVPYKLYILQLEQGKYYVGITKNVDKRFKRHEIGKGANWTRLYKPVAVIQTIETTVFTESEAAKLEDELTFDIAKQYGIANVRGGGYCQTSPKWPQFMYDL